MQRYSRDAQKQRLPCHMQDACFLLQNRLSRQLKNHFDHFLQNVAIINLPMAQTRNKGDDRIRESIKNKLGKLNLSQLETESLLRSQRSPFYNTNQ